MQKLRRKRHTGQPRKEWRKMNEVFVKKEKSQECRGMNAAKMLSKAQHT
jgi:hypothetical protein